MSRSWKRVSCSTAPVRRRSPGGSACQVVPRISTSPASGDLRFSVGRDLEGALHVGGAILARQPDLLRRRLDAPERRMRDRDALFARDVFGERG